ncbi:MULTISPECIES: transposase [Halopseudomonas]|jgi:REP element-mobilizing transposase RayT|uniref:transposase n=1 Tax=Halopseudomonas TaxID=2901189 RepID=UPI001D1973CD|nr:transposase [Halopseudomonas aestusnigri]MCC4262598.1 hypothetical protein [Halopseudomonas aestusnigri]MCK5533219.1 hypothetical protein [Halopseudomonas aestusnigri]|tara:strand:+ start:6406 stop:7047 length:642 start_codon:yes stop_codon:yes gene_type:complete
MLCPFGGAFCILRCEGLRIRLTGLLRHVPPAQTLRKTEWSIAMAAPPRIPVRRSVRLRRFDYRSPNVFFITLCTGQRRCSLGRIDDGVMHPSTLGCLVERLWRQIQLRFPHVLTDDLVLMPNHLHGVLQISTEADLTQKILQQEGFGKPVPGSLPTVMRSFKSAVTREARLRGLLVNGVVWQRGYYEHVIRNEQDYQRIAQYMADNPVRWQQD